MKDRLLEAIIAERDDVADLDPAERRLALRSVVIDAVGEKLAPSLLTELADSIDGFGPIAALMRDDAVTDVWVNGPFDVWVERAGRTERSAAEWSSEADLRAFIDRWLGEAGVHADASYPIADGCLPDGSRVHVVLPPVAPNGPLISIRRWPRRRYLLDDLVRLGTLDGGRAEELRAAVAERKSIAVSGGTGAGKTTLLNALLPLVGDNERIVLIEELKELRPDRVHVVSLVARPPNVEGKGTIGLGTLVRAALRMRPDRIVVGEVRGPEALDALAAMSTGHEGSMITLHARSAADAIERMITLAMSSPAAPGEEMLRRRVVDALDLVVHLERVPGGRVVAEVSAP